MILRMGFGAVAIEVTLDVTVPATFVDLAVAEELVDLDFASSTLAGLGRTVDVEVGGFGLLGGTLYSFVRMDDAVTGGSMVVVAPAASTKAMLIVHVFVPGTRVVDVGIPVEVAEVVIVSVVAGSIGSGIFVGLGGSGVGGVVVGIRTSVREDRKRVGVRGCVGWFSRKEGVGFVGIGGRG